MGIKLQKLKMVSDVEIEAMPLDAMVSLLKEWRLMPDGWTSWSSRTPPAKSDYSYV
jgi:hypothetical protein